MAARLGVNIDHVATLREVRKERYPDIIRAANAAVAGGADGITVHLREDRRHIQDSDIVKLKENLTVPMNLEVSSSEEMVELALFYMPEHICLVPERREELTTEGGLDLVSHFSHLAIQIAKLKNKGIQVSLFIDSDEEQIRAASELQTDVIEIHTGRYANTQYQNEELDKITKAVNLAAEFGIEVHAGHGLTLENLQPLCKLDLIKEFNIGHAIVAESVFRGLKQVVRQYKQLISDFS